MKLLIKDGYFGREFYGYSVALDDEINSIYIYQIFEDALSYNIYKLPKAYWEVSQLNIKEFVEMVYCYIEEFKYSEEGLYYKKDLIKELLRLTKEKKVL